MKPQPLDLEFDKIMKEFFIKYKGFDEKNWQKFWKDYKKSEIIQDIKLIIDLYKQCLKSTCELYLRYKDKPELFVKELPEYREGVDKIWCKYRGLTSLPPSADEDFMREYNDWLFKFIFKPVLEDDK